MSSVGAVNPYTAPVDSLVAEKDADFQIVRPSPARRAISILMDVSMLALPWGFLFFRWISWDWSWSWSWALLLGIPLWTIASGWWKSSHLERGLLIHPITLSGEALYGGIGTIRPPRGHAAGDYIFVTADALVFGVELPEGETTQWMALSFNSIQSVSRLRRLPRRTLRLETDSGAFTLDSSHPKLWLRLIQDRIEDSPLIPPWPESRKPVEWSQ